MSGRGPLHSLDAGNYRAVIRNGVPMIERDDTIGAVNEVLIPVSRHILPTLSDEWSEPLRIRIEDGVFVFRHTRDDGFGLERTG